MAGESMKNLSSQLDSALAEAGMLPAPGTRRARSMPAPAAMLGFTAEMDAMQKQVGRPLRVRIDLCDDGDMHATPVDQGRVDELIPNLRANGQTSSATVRLKADGRYEILAGRHRKYALLAIGETEWDVLIKDIDDDAAERLTFYDNLMAPNLTDFARYKGFSRRRESKGLTLEQLAQESGVSKSTIGRLLTFSLLPAGAEELIARRPEAFGSALVDQMSQHVKTHAERVLAAIQGIAAGNLEGKDAIKFITQPTPAKRAEVRTSVIKAGRRSFAKLAVRGQQLTITLTDSSVVAEIEKRVTELLQEHSKAQGNTQDSSAQGN